MAEKNSNKRLYILLVIAVAIFALYFIDGGVPMFLGNGNGDNVASTKRIQSRITELKKFDPVRDDIEATYQNLEPVYIERTAQLKTLKIGDEPYRSFVRKLLESQLQVYSVTNAVVNVGQPEEIYQTESGSGIQRIIADVSFTTGSNRNAMTILKEFGTPANGMRWEEFKLSADRNKQQVELNGQVALLVVDLPK